MSKIKQEYYQRKLKKFAEKIIRETGTDYNGLVHRSDYESGAGMICYFQRRSGEIVSVGIPQPNSINPEDLPDGYEFEGEPISTKSFTEDELSDHLKQQTYKMLRRLLLQERAERYLMISEAWQSVAEQSNGRARNDSNRKEVLSFYGADTRDNTIGCAKEIIRGESGNVLKLKDHIEISLGLRGPGVDLLKTEEELKVRRLQEIYQEHKNELVEDREWDDPRDEVRLAVLGVIRNLWPYLAFKEKRIHLKTIAILSKMNPALAPAIQLPKGTATDLTMGDLTALYSYYTQLEDRYDVKDDSSSPYKVTKYDVECNEMLAKEYGVKQ